MISSLNWRKDEIDWFDANPLQKDWSSFIFKLCGSLQYFCAKLCLANWILREHDDQTFEYNKAKNVISSRLVWDIPCPILNNHEQQVNQ
jgi:hypothetical protein